MFRRRTERHSVMLNKIKQLETEKPLQLIIIDANDAEISERTWDTTISYICEWASLCLIDTTHLR